jgi:dihydropyrimidinase
MPEIIAAGVSSFKCFMACKGIVMSDDSTLFRGLKTAKEHGALISVHAENGDASDYTPYEGMEVSGGIDNVFVRGKPVIKKGNFVGKAGPGKFIQRRRFSLYGG